MISNSEIDSLRDFSSNDDHPVVSVYLNVDGGRYPTKADYETEFSAMVSNARKKAREELGFSRDQEAALDAELAAIGNFLTLDFKRNGVRGLAIFSCRPEKLWQVTGLGVPLDNRIQVDWKARVAPLVETLANFERICVLMTSKETARILTVYAGEVTEQSEILDSVLKHHEQGGWEQAKIQRKHEKQVREHLKKAANATLDYFKAEKFDRLAVSVNDDLWPELEKILHPYLKEKVIGRFSAEITAPLDVILSEVEMLEQKQHRQEDAALVGSLGPELAGGRNFVGGIDGVLAMLNERRVELLIVESGFHQPGRACPACNTLESSEEVCPSCAQIGKPVPDVVSEAKELAIRQDARIITLPAGDAAMEQAGGIAAKLRY